MAASELRNAIESKKVEEVGVLSMLLICEALNGGFALDFKDSMKSERSLAIKAAPFLSSQGKRKQEAKTQLYEQYAVKHPGDNRTAVEELRKSCPTSDDGVSPFYWVDRTLIERKTGKLILFDDMKAQLQKARERMNNRALQKA